jgi:hypothetical protein
MPKFKPGSFVRVWRGALTASPGMPPDPCPEAETFIGEVGDTNSANQVYIWPRWTTGGRPLTATGLFVWASAIIGLAVPPVQEKP